MPRPVNRIGPTGLFLSGLAVTGVGIVAAWLVHLHPEGLRAPAWLVFAACSCFVIVGLALALHSFVSRRVLEWAMLVLLAIMTGIPAWIAFGPGERHCTSSVTLLASEFGCRIVFGVGAVSTAGLLVFSVALARRGKKAD